jgi:hypothetical protein|tara:strand:- start:5587 stop:5931 length:345 start_codon:yes stop_codon:yes gene_type:complete
MFRDPNHVLGGVIVLMAILLMAVCLYYDKMKTNTCILVLCAVLIIVAKYTLASTVKEPTQISTNCPVEDILSHRASNPNVYDDPNVNPQKPILGLIYTQPDGGSFKDKVVSKDI